MTVAQVLWRPFRAIAGLPFRWLRSATTLVIGNPIISREMKVRMRFARSFWLQGAYLLFLIAIVLLAYQGILVYSPISHPADLQNRLQAFYYTLLYSLVSVIVLIAPALTASAISFERERRTLDLLLTTPLRPMQILVGKLVASFAFLMLLLVESMPIVTVCIVMGGATVGDLLATYALIGFSTLHLCAFAIYCSACNRSSGLATFWAYLGVIAGLSATFWMALVEVVFLTPPGPMLGVPGSVAQRVVFPLSSLQPFSAPVIKAAPTKLFGVEIPCWLIGAVFSLLLTRFWLTAAAARLPAVYRSNFVGSLRRQGLMLTVLAALTIDALLTALLTPRMNRDGQTLGLLVGTGFICLFVALFVPWIATFGEHEGKKPINDGWFRPLRMFQPVASGALPFVWTWFSVLVAAMSGLLIWRTGVQPFWDKLAFGFGYCLLCLTFFWAISRFWSSVVRQLSLARWVSFGTLLLIAILPGISKWSLAYPFVRIAEEASPTVALESFVAQVQIHGLVVLGLTVALVLACFVLERKAARTVKADEG
jgi:ABC-type transport system involved in multi-copper enzyme maturation permease subunit